MPLPVHHSRIIEIDGEITRCFVASTKPGKQPYLVDLLAYWGNGQCGCEHFRFKLEPKVSRKQNTEPMWCKHLAQAFAAFGHTVARRMAEGQFKQEHHQHD